MIGLLIILLFVVVLLSTIALLDFSTDCTDLKKIAKRPVLIVRSKFCEVYYIQFKSPILGRWLYYTTSDGVPVPFMSIEELKSTLKKYETLR